MASPTTFIKLDRNIRNWRWYQDANTMRVFLEILLTANIQDHEYQGVIVHRGEVLTSYDSIAKKCNISKQSVRTAISHLKSTQEITSTQYPKFQVIAIVNYDKYQQKPTRKSHANQQSTNTQLTPLKEYIKNNKEYIGARAPDGGACQGVSEAWVKDAKKRGMTIEEYVRWRNQ